MSVKPKSVDERLVLMPNGCMEWNGSRDKNGYGTMRLYKKDWKVHRFVYQRAYGEIKKGEVICHKCDNPPCANIDHLFKGTPKINTLDSVKKKRNAFGEKNGFSKLNENSVRAIKKMLLEGQTQTEIAKTFGLNQTTISKINLGISWKHIV